MSEPQTPEEHSEQSAGRPPVTGWRSSRTFAWLQLFRAPNLLTVPGDLAGLALAGR